MVATLVAKKVEEWADNLVFVMAEMLAK